MKRIFFSYLFLFIAIATVYGQEIAQFEIFAGRFDYLAFGNTLNLTENGSDAPCEILTASTATFQLSSEQTVIAAYLYWAGSGTGDFEVLLNDTPIIAQRTFTDQIDDARVFFAAFADVTEILQSQGNGDYTLSELDITQDIEPYCPTGTNFGGWAITVIYEDDSLPLNVVNVFDGLESVSALNNELTIELENLNVLDNEDAKIGFVAWEGDAGLAVDETLSINGNVLSNPPLNPANNQFNGTNSFTDSSDLYNMDIDVYSIENNIDVGDTSALISLTSGQDFVMINSIITVLNSQLPDAVVLVDMTTSECESRELFVAYTIQNIGTDILPSSTPVTFYIDDIAFQTTLTTTAIPFGESLVLFETLDIPDTINDDFILTIRVDDNGFGEGVVNEINENNNDSNAVAVSLNDLPIELPLLALTSCDEDGDGVSFFDLTTIGDAATGGDPFIVVSYHLLESDALENINPIQNPETYENIESLEFIFLRFTSTEDEECLQIESTTINILTLPHLPELEDLEACDDMGNDGVAIFNLNPVLESIIEQQANVVVSFFRNENDALSNQNPIGSLDSYQNIPNQEFIFVRISNEEDIACFVISQFSISIQPVNMTNALPNLIACNEGFEISTFDLSTVGDFFLVNSPASVTGYYLTEENAFQEMDPIEDIFDYQNTSNPQTIFVRTDLNDGSVCPQFSRFELIVENCPPFVPDGFSPNFDGINDVFEISGLKDVFQNYKLLIYSRLGNLVYEGDNDTMFWDGIPNRGISGSQVPTGVYFWVLRLNDSEINDRTGWVYLNR